MRKYIQEVIKTKGDAEPTWLTWALAKADWYDPMVKTEDALLADVDKNTLKFNEYKID
ncbi:MAG TPA: hypothetical protein PLX35_09750 [Cyclobacteriaceae bacterium]|nr:hypothetical protein [Cyclobacteriaceae bacterium]